MFKGPPLMSRAGRFIWSGMVLLYWSLAFIVGAAIPQVQTISGLVAAVCIMQVNDNPSWLPMTALTLLSSSPTHSHH
jgi:hypothetical protein